MLFQGNRPELSTIANISLPYTLMIIVPSIIPIALTLIYVTMVIFRILKCKVKFYFKLVKNS